MKQIASYIAIFLLLMTLAVTVDAQQPLPAVYVDMTEVGGLTPDGKIPAGGADLTIPVRFHNVDVARTAISNGYFFDSDEITITGMSVEWNPDYCWVWPFIPEWWCPEGVFFDQGTFTNAINKGLGGYGMVGLTGGIGVGLPADFHDIAYTFTLTDIQGPPGAVLTIDSTWWEPANFWLWSGVGPYIWWYGPYQWEMGSEPCCEAPIITSTPPERTLVAGDNYSYNVNATGLPDPEFHLSEAPEGMTIDALSGQISWICQVGVHHVTVVADNDIPPAASQSFEITVYPADEPYTTCWPQPIRLKALDNDRILNVSIWNENFAMIDWSTIRVFNIPPYTEVRQEGDSLVTDVAVMRFLGVGGFRPVPSLGYEDAEYTVSYTMLDGTQKGLVGLFDLSMTAGDVTFDGLVNIEDILLMTDFLFSKGPKASLWNEEMDECMDIDGNGRIDLLDVRELISIVM